MVPVEQLAINQLNSIPIASQTQKGEIGVPSLHTNLPAHVGPAATHSNTYRRETVRV
jgi:hypothetical protein